MAKPLSILFVSSEVQPFIKVGGIAEVTYSFPLAVRDIGHDIRVMVPKYGSVSERRNRIHEINRLRDIPIPIGNHSEPATIKSSSIFNPRVKVQAYITTNQKYFDSKKGIYYDAKTGKLYPDNVERFVFFSRSVIETCLLLGWFPDIIHCNDWHSAFIPVIARVLFPKEFKKTKFIYTIHNFGSQGEIPLKEFDITSLPSKLKTELEHKKNINLVKGALLYSDYITTISPTYAREIIADPKLSNDLNVILKKKHKIFKGIINGVDPWSWDPKADSFIHTKFDDNLKNFKSANKRDLITKFGLNNNGDIPIFGMVSRLDEEKGISLLINSLDQIFKENVQLVMLCDGTSEARNQIKDVAQKYSKQLKIKFGFEEHLAHLIPAGSDIYLMPSKSEPCGIRTMYSLLYGSIPVVRETGGLSEIVKEFNPDTKKGNGFVFKNYKSTEFVGAIKRALNLYKNKAVWEIIMSNGMKEDFSWTESVKTYDEIYRSLMKD
jgi:starch synthase